MNVLRVLVQIGNVRAHHFLHRTRFIRRATDFVLAQRYQTCAIVCDISGVCFYLASVLPRQQT